MHAVRRLTLALVLVALVAVAAVAANLMLLRSTEDSSDPVGRLSPRAVFSTPAETPSQPQPSGGVTTPSGDDGRPQESGPDD